MTTAADDRAVEETFEASLAGRPVRGEAAGLAAFTGAVRSAATQPGRPNAALAELLSTGLLTDQSSPSTRTAPAAGPLPSRSARSRTRRRLPMIVPALLAKLLSAGAVAQAATGAGVVVVVVTGAGTAGVLPAGAQKTFSDMTGIHEVVDRPADGASDLEGTEPVDAADDLSDPAVVAVPDASLDAAEDVVEPVPSQAELAWRAGPAEGQTFGEWVSLGQHEGWATGEIVSAKKREINDVRKGAREAAKAAREAARAAARQGDDSDDSDDSGSEGSEVEDESSDDDGDRSGKGKGKGSGHGKGRGGRG